MKRRSFLKGSIATSTLTVAAGAGLLRPTLALAEYPTAAFDAEDAMGAVKNFFGSADAAESARIVRTQVEGRAPVVDEHDVQLATRARAVEVRAVGGDRLARRRARQQTKEDG